MTLKITLVDVGSPRHELNEPLGMEVLAGTLSRNFANRVDIHMEWMQLPKGLLDGKHTLEDNDVIGISTKLYSLERVKTILMMVRHISRPSNGGKPLILLGDLLATFAYEHLLNYSEDCICVLGEGEDAMSGVIQVLLDLPSMNTYEVKQTLLKTNVPNLAFTLKGKLQMTNRKLVDLNVAAKPMRSFLHEIIDKQGIVRIEGSRGCPWGRCTFCAISAKYGRPGWRPFPINKIIDELAELSAAGSRSPYFTDEDFIGDNPQRAAEIAEAIRQAKQDGRIDKKLNFYVNVPAEAVVEHNLILTKLEDAGLREVFIGLESGSKGQIRRYGKRPSVKTNMEAVDILRKMGITMDMGFIMFDPEMTLEDLKENMDFIRETGLVSHDARDIKRVRVEPGTELQKQLEAKGVIKKLDANSLTYPYSFSDPRIQKIADAFEEWEDHAKETVYLIQARTRGEIRSEHERNRLKERLGKLRDLDFKVLETLVNMMNGNLDGFNDKRIMSKAMERFEEERDGILASFDRLE